VAIREIDAAIDEIKRAAILGWEAFERPFPRWTLSSIGAAECTSRSSSCIKPSATSARPRTTVRCGPQQRAQQHIGEPSASSKTASEECTTTDGQWPWCHGRAGTSSGSCFTLRLQRLLRLSILRIYTRSPI